MQSLQDRYCDFDACERFAERMTAKDGRPRLVRADELGYWYPALLDDDEGYSMPKQYVYARREKLPDSPDNPRKWPVRVYWDRACTTAAQSYSGGFQPTKRTKRLVVGKFVYYLIWLPNQIET